MTFDKKISRFVSTLTLLVLGSVASIEMGCAAADPEDSDLNASVGEETVAEAELALGVGELCFGAGCDTGLACCLDSGDLFGTCRNVSTDEQHCGQCGKSCHPDQQCVSGVCKCPSGQTLCAAGCVNLNNNRQNCGACGNRCTNLEYCILGECELF